MISRLRRTCQHAALYAIEKILDCRTQPCVAGRKSIARQLDAMRQLPRPSDVEFGPMHNLSEINGNVQAAKRKAKGYRTKRNLKAIVYLIAGDVLASSPI